MSMEIPEGFIKLQNSVLDDGSSPYIGVDGNHFSKALDLMEEMAEALSYCADAFSEIETRDLSLNLKEAEKKAIQVLDKFKEWK